MVSSAYNSINECASKHFDDLNFAQVIESHVTCSLSEFNTASTTGSFKTKALQPIDHVTLSNRWNIPKDRAR